MYKYLTNHLFYRNYFKLSLYSSKNINTFSNFQILILVGIRNSISSNYKLVVFKKKYLLKLKYQFDKNNKNNYHQQCYEWRSE